MIQQNLLTKKVKSTRTYKYKIVGNTNYYKATHIFVGRGLV